MMITNLFLYNPALCTITSENVSEFVKQDQYYIQEEAERIGIWELVHRRVNDQDIGVWLEDMPHRTPVPVPVPVDENQTCEDAAYNQRNPVPEVEIPVPQVETPVPQSQESSVETHLPQTQESSVESDGDVLQITEEQFAPIMEHLLTITNKAVEILNVTYPAILDPNLPPVDIPDSAMKKAVFTAVMECNREAWTAKSAEEVMDSNSIGNMYITLVQSAQDTAESDLEKRLYRHLATSLTIVNSVSAVVNIPIEFDAQLKNAINGEFYKEVYEKFEF